MGKNVKSSGIPHLAKNERDVGPMIPLQVETSRSLQPGADHFQIFILDESLSAATLVMF